MTDQRRHQEPLSCRACRILRAELGRVQRESESRAASDAEQCAAMFSHMERLARLNMALVQQRPHPRCGQSMTPPSENQVVTRERGSTEPQLHVETPRMQRLQATIVQQANEIERLQRQLRTMVPLLALDGRGGKRVERADSNSESAVSQDDDQRQILGQRRRRGMEKLPLTSLHARLKARDATIRRLEQHASQLLDKLNEVRDKKSQALGQYHAVTKAQQMQLKKYAAQLQEQQRVHREGLRERKGLQAYVVVLERKLLAKASTRAASPPPCWELVRAASGSLPPETTIHRLEEAAGTQPRD